MRSQAHFITGHCEPEGRGNLAFVGATHTSPLRDCLAPARRGIPRNDEVLAARVFRIKAIQNMLILAFCFLLAGYAWTEQEKLSVMISLFPGDEEIPGWRRAEKLLRATNEEELYKIFNGGAELYIQNGFHSYAGQSYRGPKGTELEVHIFHQTDSKNAESLYENRFTRPVRSKEIANLGEKARIDMTPLFCYGIDFIQQGFFVRVIIQERTEEGLKTAISFARSVGKRLPLAKPPRSPR